MLCLVASVAAAQDYERAIEEARRLLADESKPLGERFDAQYERLGRLALATPDRWEAFFERGQNRCKRAFFYRGEVDASLARGRASGLDEVRLARAREEADAQIDTWITEAHREFSVAEAVMARRGEWRPDHELILFASASLKFAGREYLKARHGERGAIDDYKELVQRNFLPERCVDHITLCYLDVGHESFLKQDFESAQRAWDEGLRWARQPYLQQLLWTNKAGAYEMDHQYALAEKVLHEQIAREPNVPAHHKNLGLVLGFENRLKEALYHYDIARELCRKSDDLGVALVNGNAWLRPAVIHGTLLEQDGDMLVAWRLFLEYRELFGDDYNFSLWFGDFAAAHGAYDLAWHYLEHARDLQPRCPAPYQKLAQVAPRTSGTREEVEVRTKAATQALFDAKARYVVVDETPAVLKICGGVADLGDAGIGPERTGVLEPDPLAGFDALHPPAWVEEAARSRDPFVPFDPSAKAEAPAEGSAPAGRRASWAALAASAGALLLLGGAALFFFRRATA